MSEFYDSTEDLEAQVCDVYDESRPRWYSSLRDKPEDTKPAWSLARKKDSPSVRTYAEGGSLATARQRPREPCAKRHSTSHHRSKSPGVVGSTFASRARQREPVTPRLVRPRAASVVTRPPERPKSRARSLSPRRFRRQSASPARPAPSRDEGRSRREAPRPKTSKTHTPAAVSIPVNLHPDKEKTPPPRLIPISRTEEKMISTLETSWNDRYLFEPVGPTMGRTNIMTENSDLTDIYKQQSSETAFNSFLGKSVERSHSVNSHKLSSLIENESASRKTSDNHQLRDSRVASQNGQSASSSGTNYGQSSAMSSKKSSSNQNSNFYSKSSSYSSSYQKTNINGEENESSGYDEKHYDSRNGHSSFSSHFDSRNGDRNGNNAIKYSISNDTVSSSRNNNLTTEMERRNERQRRESSRKLSGPLPLWMTAAEEDTGDNSQVRRSSVSSSKKSVSKVYIA